MGSEFKVWRGHRCEARKKTGSGRCMNKAVGIHPKSSIFVCQVHMPRRKTKKGR